MTNILRSTTLWAAFAALFVGFVVAASVSFVTASEHCDATVQDGESIQDAIDAASPGDTICVEAGEYEETLTVHVEGVTLEGAGSASSTVISEVVPNPVPAVLIDADNVTFEGFEVIKDGGSQNVPTVAIGEGVVNTLLRDLDVKAPGYNIDGAGSPSVAHTAFNQTIGDVVVDSVTADRAIGFHLMEGANVTITDSTVSRSHDEGIWLAWAEWWEGDEAGAVLMTGNDIQDSYRSGGSGPEVVLSQTPITTNGDVLSAADSAERIVCDNLVASAEVEGEFSDSCPVMGEITSPTEGEVVVGTLELAATYTGNPDDDVFWAVREGTCDVGSDTVLGNVDGSNDPYVWQDGEFSASFDVSEFDEGTYCFAFNPGGNDNDVRETVEFSIEHLALPDPDPEDPIAKDQCKDGGWEDHGFRNQGQCIRFVNTGRDSR